MLIALSWSNGNVTLWDPEKRTAKQDSSLHYGKTITVINWSLEGTKLITADNEDVIGVWKTDYQNRLILLLSYHLEQLLPREITFSVLCFTWIYDREYYENQIPFPTAPRYFIAGLTYGYLTLLSTSELKHNFVQLDGIEKESIIKLFCNESEMNIDNQIYALSSAGTLCLCEVKRNGINLISKLNLNWTDNKDILNVKILMCTKSNILITLPSNSQYPSATKLSNFSNNVLTVDKAYFNCLNISYSLNCASLLTLFSSGHIFIWKEKLGEINQLIKSDKINLNYKFLSQQPMMTVYSRGKSLKLALCSNENQNEKGDKNIQNNVLIRREPFVRFYVESKQLTCMHDKLAVIQVQSDKLEIHYGHDNSLRLETGFNVSDLIVKNHYIVATGTTRTVVYEVSITYSAGNNKESKQNYYPNKQIKQDHIEVREVSNFNDMFSNVDILGENLFRAYDNYVEISTIEGIVRSKIAFSDDYAVPQKLFIGANILFVLSESQNLYMYNADTIDFALYLKPFNINTVIDIFAIEKNAEPDSCKQNDKAISKDEKKELQQKYFEAVITKLSKNMNLTSIKANIKLRLVVSEAKSNKSGEILCLVCDIYNNNQYIEQFKNVFLLYPQSMQYTKVEVYESIAREFYDTTQNTETLCDTIDIIQVFWDMEEDNIFGVLASFPESDIQMLNVYFLIKDTVKLLQSIQIRQDFQAIGLKIPFYFIAKKNTVSKEKPSVSESKIELKEIISTKNNIETKIESQVLTAFEEVLAIIKTNPTIKQTLLTFLYFLSNNMLQESVAALEKFKVDSKFLYEKLIKKAIEIENYSVASDCCLKLNMEYLLLLPVLYDKLKIEFNESSNKTKLGFIAFEFGEKVKAESLLSREKRYDIIAFLYENEDDFEKALSISEHNDIVNLNRVRFNFAKHLESERKLNEAAFYYQLSSDRSNITAESKISQVQISSSICKTVPCETCFSSFVEIREITRMYLDNNMFNKLVHMFGDSKNVHYGRWLGCYYESMDLVSKAKHTYSLKQDFLSLIRLKLGDISAGLKTNQDHIQQIQEILNSKQFTHTVDKYNSFYIIAKKYEELNDINNAISYYEQSKKYTSALRLAKLSHLHDHVFRIAMKHGAKRILLTIAKYFLKQSKFDFAARMFYQAKRLKVALKICFESKLYNLLIELVASMEKSDVLIDTKASDENIEIFVNCSKFFEVNGKYSSCLDLLMAARQVDRCMEVCTKYSVPLTNTKVNKLLTLIDSKYQEKSERLGLYSQIAKCCENQKAFSLSTKVYLKIGDKISAMKSLIGSGNRQKILFFAKQSRMKEIYILAGNYLQTLNFKKDTTIVESIIWSYTKAKEFSKLAQFYHNSAKDEVLSYKDYAAAQVKLKLALQYVDKAFESVEESNIVLKDKVQVIKNTLYKQHEVISEFTLLLANCEENNAETKQENKIENEDASKGKRKRFENILNKLCEENNVIEDMLPLGDVYATFCLYLLNQEQDANSAYEILCQMEGCQLILTQYLKEEEVKEIVAKSGRTDFEREAYYGLNNILSERESNETSKSEMSSIHSEISEYIETKTT